MNSYQIHKAVLFWAPHWEAGCRRIFLYVQNDKAFHILFCIWQRFQRQLHRFTAIAFPNLPFLHKLTRFKFASVLLFIMLPLVAGEYSLGGKTILIVADTYIKTQLVYPLQTSYGCHVFIGRVLQSIHPSSYVINKIFILPNPLKLWLKSITVERSAIQNRNRSPWAHPQKIQGWQMPNLSLYGTASFLLNSSLCLTLGNHFFQRNSFHLDSAPAFPTHLAHSTRPDSTKQIHFGKKIACHSFQEFPGTQAKHKEAPRYRLTTKSCSYYLPIKQATRCETILFWFR